jgi:hypothetical protein
MLIYCAIRYAGASLASISYRCLGGVARSHALHLDIAADTDDFPMRWRLIKLLFSKGLPRTERLSARLITKRVS